MAFYLFRRHDVMPDEYARMSPGQREAALGFALREIELRKEELAQRQGR